MGVGGGLGLALVEAFAGQGLTVYAAARAASGLESLTGLGDQVVACDCDGTDPAQVAGLFERIAGGGRPLAAAIYNAGAFEPGKVVEIEAQDFERCWRVGCFGGFLLGQGAARLMLKQGHGTILFTGATASLRGGAGFANLASPKFALRALSQSMARELGPKGIHVAHVIIDGQIHSPRYAHLTGERGPDSLLAPEAIAQAYVDLHRQPRSAWTQELDLRPWVERF